MPHSTDIGPASGAIRRFGRRRMTIVGALVALATALGIWVPSACNPVKDPHGDNTQDMATLEDEGKRIVLHGSSGDDGLQATVEHYYLNRERDVRFQKSLATQLGFDVEAHTVLVVTLSRPANEAQSQPDGEGDGEGEGPTSARTTFESVAVTLTAANGSVSSRSLHDIATRTNGQARILLNGFTPPVTLGHGESVRLYLAFPGAVDLRTVTAGTLQATGHAPVPLAPRTDTYTTPPGLRGTNEPQS